MGLRCAKQTSTPTCAALLCLMQCASEHACAHQALLLPQILPAVLVPLPHLLPAVLHLPRNGSCLCQLGPLTLPPTSTMTSSSSLLQPQASRRPPSHRKDPCSCPEALKMRTTGRPPVAPPRMTTRDSSSRTTATGPPNGAAATLQACRRDNVHKVTGEAACAPREVLLVVVGQRSSKGDLGGYCMLHYVLCSCWIA